MQTSEKKKKPEKYLEESALYEAKNKKQKKKDARQGKS